MAHEAVYGFMFPLGGTLVGTGSYYLLYNNAPVRVHVTYVVGENRFEMNLEPHSWGWSPVKGEARVWSVIPE